MFDILCFVAHIVFSRPCFVLLQFDINLKIVISLTSYISVTKINRTYIYMKLIAYNDLANQVLNFDTLFPNHPESPRRKIWPQSVKLIL